MLTEIFMIRKKNTFFVTCILLAYATLLPIHHIGQRFILSLPETNDQNFLQSWLSKTKPAGVMLLASHFQQRAKTKELISFLQQEAKNLGLPPLLITVDWEGGIISRPNHTGGFNVCPSPWLLGQAGAPSCFLAGMLIGSQLRSIGVTMNFAPSLDLYDQENHILATRCFSDQPERVAECGIAFAQGLMCEGILPVIKHYPGLGLGSHDTHLTSVNIDADASALRHHTVPFEHALDAKVPCVMVTHATLQQLDHQPATLSKKVIAHLKKKYPDALFITDDFSMKAINPHNCPDEAIFKALDAGYDRIIFSGTATKQIELINRCQKKYASQTWPTRKSPLSLKKTGPVLTIEQEKKLAHFLAQRCLQNTCIPKLSHKKITLVTTNLPMIRTPETWFIAHGKSYMRTKLEQQGYDVDEIILNPKDHASITLLKNKLDQEPATNSLLVQTLFYADNIWNQIQQQWLEALKPFDKNLIIFSLGHPYEQSIIPSAQIINLGSFHPPLLDVVVKRLCSQPALTGADQLARTPEYWLKNKRFALLCHRCSMVQRDDTLLFLPTVLHEWAQSQKDQTKLVALFCPEHGLFGTKEAFANIDSNQTSEWGCPIYSLHGQHKKPTPDMIKNIDTLVIDLQDIGTRCFTYLSTLQFALEAAVENKIDVIVLDRPNPLAFWKSGGPMLEKEFQSFVGKVYVPFLHGMTIGALARARILRQAQDERSTITVIDCKNCDNDFFFNRPFIPPSPNLCSIDHIFAYPLTVFLEGTNYSEGRGTPWPFLQFGAPWVDGKNLAAMLNGKNLAGIYFQPTHFVPQKIAGVAENPKHKDTHCQGVLMHLYDRESAQPMTVARTILETLFELYPDKSQWITWGKQYGIDLLVGNDSWRKELG